MRTANPALQPFVQPQTWDSLNVPAAATMTVNGTINKTALLIAICASAAVATYQVVGANPGLLTPAWIGALVISLIAGFTLYRAPRLAPFLAPPFAAVEGVFAGAFSLFISHWVATLKPGLVPETLILQAVLLTFGILFAMLAAFRLGLIRLGSTATKVVLVATAGVAVYYIAGMVIGLFVPSYQSLGWNAGPIGIGFSLFVVALASLNLVLDFQFIEAGVMNKAPKHMEWYGAFGLLVTLVWLYVEVLRLLAKLQARD